MKRTALRLEVHEHARLRGAGPTRITHSHEGGDAPHEHPGTGCSAYVIDKDEWAARTGMKGGGRKKFTPAPSGEQLRYVAIGPPEFDVVIVGDGGASAAGNATGPGTAIIDRLELSVGARVRSVRRTP